MHIIIFMNIISLCWLLVIDFSILYLFWILLILKKQLQPFHWILLLAIIFLNWLRNALDIHIMYCDHDDDVCKANDSMHLFVITGFEFLLRLFLCLSFRDCALGSLVFVFSFVFAIMARYRELKIISLKNLKSLRSYAHFLRVSWLFWPEGTTADLNFKKLI